MTYSARDLSVQDGDPVHLVLFTRNDESWRYTSSASPVSYLGDTYQPTSIGMGSINQSTEMLKDTLTLRFPRDHEFASVFLGAPVEHLTSVTVFRGHAGDVDSEFITYWKGRVASSKASGDVLSLECEPVFTSMRRPGLRARYQKTCRHAHYGRGCKLDPEAVAVIGTCTAVDGVDVVVPEAAALPAGTLVGGMLRAPDGTLRYIVEHNGENIKLMRPIYSLVPATADGGYGLNYGELYGGDALKMYPGCDHTRATCDSKFNNLDNFGGFPWIPGKNPMGGSSIV